MPFLSFALWYQSFIPKNPKRKKTNKKKKEKKFACRLDCAWLCLLGISSWKIEFVFIFKLLGGEWKTSHLRLSGIELNDWINFFSNRLANYEFQNARNWEKNRLRKDSLHIHRHLMEINLNDLSVINDAFSLSWCSH